MQKVATICNFTCEAALPSDPVFNSPEARQRILKARAAAGEHLSLAALAQEFGVSPDTVRRDLLALEGQGAVQRVRGGALPVLAPSEPVLKRMQTASPVADRLAAAALPLIEDGMVLMLDGGATVARLAALLPHLPRALIVTPAPVVAMATLAVGTETQLIGGHLSRFGGISVGQRACEDIAAVAADLCMLGACGLEADFGLSADISDEAAVKRAMRSTSHRCIVVTGREKLGRRARHRVVPCAEIDLLITDAPPDETGALAATGLEIRHA